MVKARRVGAFLVAHALLAALMLVLLAALGRLAEALGNPLLLGLVSIIDVLDLGEAVIILSFVFYGGLEAIRLFREPSDGRRP